MWRPEKGLADLGQVLGIGRLEKPLSTGHRFASNRDPALHRYNAQDPHATVLEAVALARHLHTRTYGGASDRQLCKVGDQLGEACPCCNPWTRQHFSDLLWSAIHLQESGLGCSLTAIDALEARSRTRTARCTRAAATLPGAPPLAGKGSLTTARRWSKAAIELADGLYDDSAFKPTPTGHPPTSKLQRRLILNYLPDRHSDEARFLRLLDRHSAAATTLSNFTGKYRKAAVGPTERPDHVRLIWSSWHLTPGQFKDNSGSSGGTGQVRITATKPPIQTSPESVKGCFASRYAHGFLLTMDLSQIELRMAALQSGDPFLCDAYASDPDFDFHTSLSIDIAGPAIVDHPHFHSGDNLKDPRQIYKQCNFLTLFRGYGKRLRQTIFEDGGPLLPLPKCNGICDHLRAKRRGLWAWHEELFREVRKTGRLTLPFTGHTRHFGKRVHMKNEGEIASFPVQGPAAVVLLSIQSALTPLLPPNVRLVLNTYDSLTLDGPAHRLEETKSIVETCVQREEEVGYWARLQDLRGRTVPLRYGISTKRFLL